jgi:hypothetical protein
MPEYLSPDRIVARDRANRARAYLAQARLHADVVNEYWRDGEIHSDNASSSVATMNAHLAIAEMLVPIEPNDEVGK